MMIPFQALHKNLSQRGEKELEMQPSRPNSDALWLRLGRAEFYAFFALKSGSSA